MSAGRRRISPAPIACALLTLVACSGDPVDRRQAPPDQAPAQSTWTVEPRSHLIATFPCTQCHRDRTANPTRRALTEFHVIRNAELDHGDRSLWCYQCHSVKNIDKLVIANGSLVSFDEADQLCGSCHGDKGRDWRAGIHGSTVGYWRGPKRRKLCTNCHNPHSPWFPTLAPEPPPAPAHGGGETERQQP
jgi:hypothetical protein